MSHFVKTMQHDMVEDVDSTFNDSWNHQMNEPEPSQCKVIHSDVSPRASYSNIPCHSVSLPSPSTCQYLPCLDDTTMGGNSNDSKCNTSPNSPEKLMYINPNNLAFRTEGSDNVTNITKKLTTMDFHVPTSQHVNHSPQRLNSIPSKATKRIIPTDKDVLFGRGQGVNRHIGNIRFRKIVKAMKKDYKRLATKGKRKMGLSSSLVEHIRRYGGRFLIFDANTLGWVEADMKRKREKCSQALREKMNESSHVNT